MELGTGLSDAESSPALVSKAIDSYRLTLLAVGRSAVQGYSTTGEVLNSDLRDLERQLGADMCLESVTRVTQQVDSRLREWSERTSEQLRGRADEAKRLLITLAQTAESICDRDQRFSKQFKDLTAHLETIGNLDDLTQIRASLVKQAGELKCRVDQLTRENQQLVAQLKTDVNSYEVRLKAAEHLVLKDALTGLVNRRSIEDRIQWCIRRNTPFTVVVADLNHFKKVNDAHGHLAGDDLLKQFASELRLNVRSSDVVGRWGGDEFIMLLYSDATGAKTQIDRISKWVLGNYTIRVDGGEASVNLHVDASIGLAEWRHGETMEQVIARADDAMYHEKRRSQAVR